MARLNFEETIEKEVNKLKEAEERKKSELQEIQQYQKCHQRALDVLKGNASTKSKKNQHKKEVTDLESFCLFVSHIKIIYIRITREYPVPMDKEVHPFLILC